MGFFFYFSVPFTKNVVRKNMQRNVSKNVDLYYPINSYTFYIIFIFLRNYQSGGCSELKNVYELI